MLPSKLGMNCAENVFNMGMFLQLQVSFKMGAFSDTQHTRPGMFILGIPGISLVLSVDIQWNHA